MASGVYRTIFNGPSLDDSLRPIMKIFKRELFQWWIASGISGTYFRPIFYPRPVFFSSLFDRSGIWSPWHRKIFYALAVVFYCLRAFASTAALTRPTAKHPCKSYYLMSDRSQRSIFVFSNMATSIIRPSDDNRHSERSSSHESFVVTNKLIPHNNATVRNFAPYKTFVMGPFLPSNFSKPNII